MSEKTPLTDALNPIEPEDDQAVELPNGASCLKSTFDRTHIQLLLIGHLQFLQRLNQQQDMKLSDRELLPMAVELLKADAQNSAQEWTLEAIGDEFNVFNERFSDIASLLRLLVEAYLNAGPIASGQDRTPDEALLLYDDDLDDPEDEPIPIYSSPEDWVDASE